MLARLTRELPVGGYVYEPKWDGFRTLVFRAGPRVDLRSRNQRPLGRYFPEIVDAVASLPADDVVLDGELVVIRPEGFDFEALLARLHPGAARVARLRAETPASFIAFDALAIGGRDLTEQPFHERRTELERLFRKVGPPLYLTPATENADVAREWLTRYTGTGVDGVVAKHRRLAYRPGERAMVKVKHERTVDCVVAGFRIYAGEPVVASLLLGLYDADALRHVGVVAGFPEAQRRELFHEFRRLAIDLQAHPWRDGFTITPSRIGRLAGAAGQWTPADPPDWIPVRPERVCEVAYDRVEAGRFRHAARFRRWRPDLDPRGCTFDQLDVASTHPAEVLR
jgi:ATP-dependent DNA ligase